MTPNSQISCNLRTYYILYLQTMFKYFTGLLNTGGDQITLTPSGNEIADNIISNFGRVEYVGSNGISVNGVGIHVHHNTLFKGSYKGIDIRVSICCMTILITNYTEQIKEIIITRATKTSENKFNKPKNSIE